MVKFSETTLDKVFFALSDSNRRKILSSLSNGEASVSELAASLRISLPGVMKHLKVLEDSGLLLHDKVGRTRTCQVQVAPLDSVTAWLEHYKEFWERHLSNLERYLDSKYPQKEDTCSKINKGALKP